MMPRCLGTTEGIAGSWRRRIRLAPHGPPLGHIFNVYVLRYGGIYDGFPLCES
jgi:hypothetical protein